MFAYMDPLKTSSSIPPHAAPGSVLKKSGKGEEVLALAKQTRYRSGVGKASWYAPRQTQASN